MKTIVQRIQKLKWSSAVRRIRKERPWDSAAAPDRIRLRNSHRRIVMRHTSRVRVARHAGVGRNEPESGRVNESPPGQRFTSDLLSRESLADHHRTAALRAAPEEWIARVRGCRGRCVWLLG